MIKRRNNMDWIMGIQRVFGLLCGYTPGKYIRSRRLTLAGGELAGSNTRIIDIALKYGYDNPDSFTRAFTRFHGITPSQARREGVKPNSFSRLSLKLSLGGYKMEYPINPDSIGFQHLSSTAALP